MATSSVTTQSHLHLRSRSPSTIKPSSHTDEQNKITMSHSRIVKSLVPNKGPLISRLSPGEIADTLRQHPLLCFFAASLLFFMAVEYTLAMVPPTSPPFDLGFHFTVSLNALLAASPALNSLLAALNTVFVAMQAVYIAWALLVEGRARPTIAALFMFSCRGIMGYTTQLPLPEGFLGSGMDFPVGNVSFFLFFSGHVAGAVIASLDMRRMGRSTMAAAFDALNALQVLRLLASRGHYTIDLAVGVGAGILFDALAGKYEERGKISSDKCPCNCVGCLNHS